MSKYISVEISLDEFSDEELIKELTDRGYQSDSDIELTEIWRLRINGLPYEDKLDVYLRDTLGKAI
jgi:hypothetical protein